MSKRKLCRKLLMLLCSLSLLTTYAQEKTITGKVTNVADGAPIPGVSVTVKNTNVATQTNGLGVFTFSVPASAKTLVFSAIGFGEKEAAINGSSVIVTLKEEATSLNEVVVIGYGTAKKANVTTAISSVSEKDIKNLPVAGADQVLQGKVAGVSVTNNGGQPGGGVSVRVRGITSINGNEPLYVIDGVPITGQSNSLAQNVLGGGSGSTGQSVLATLNPADIASIDILKDASAQAIYGSRAANGVVLINTKRGKAGEGKISYDTYFGVQEIPKKLDIMNLQQYAGYMNSLVNEVRAVPGSNLDSVGEFRNPSLLGHGTDWQDEVYQRGTIQSHQLSFSGGQGKTNYYFSGGYYDQVGTLIETAFKRYTLRFNLDHQVKSWLKAGISSNLSRSNQKIGLANGFDAVTSVVLYNSPAAAVRDVNGDFISQTIVGGNNFGNPSNPVAMARVRDVRTVSTKAFGAVYGEIEFLKGLTLRNEVNYNFGLNNDKAYQPFLQNERTKSIIISPSRLREQRNNSLFWGLKNFLNYNSDFGKHNFFVTLGREVQKSHYDNVYLTRDNLTLNLPSIDAGTAGFDQAGNSGGNDGNWSMESYFGRINYTFDNRISVSASMRGDGSSSFGPGKRWGYFPAGSASWTITNEAFAQDINFLSYLKLRAGAGVVGNQNVTGTNVFSANINLVSLAPFGPGGLPRNVPNPNLGWESVVTYNAGVDMTLLQRKVDLSVDVYRKTTTDMLLPTQLGVFSGLGTNWNDIQTPIANDGQITNKGIDVSLTTYNLTKKDFSWKTNLVFSHYKNTLDRLNTPDATIKGETDEYGDISLVTLSQQGLPVGSFYGYVTDGLFRTMDDLTKDGIDWGLPVGAGQQWLGDVRYKDLNGDKVIDNKDVTIIGNPNPKFTYGLTNTLNYKNFDVSLFVFGSYGADIFNYTRRQTEGLKNAYNNQLTSVLNRYTESNPNGSLPRFNQWHNNNLRISDRFIEDGSFLRIQNLAIGYNLPKGIVSKAKIANAKVYASVQNLYTFTSYSGYDPELGALNNRVTFMNVDNGHYPNPRTFTLGANIEF